MLPSRSTIPVSGRTVDGQWWQIPFPAGPNGYGWISNTVGKPNSTAFDVPVYEVHLRHIAAAYSHAHADAYPNSVCLRFCLRV